MLMLTWQGTLAHTYPHVSAPMALFRGLPPKDIRPTHSPVCLLSWKGMTALIDFDVFTNFTGERGWGLKADFPVCDGRSRWPLKISLSVI